MTRNNLFTRALTIPKETSLSSSKVEASRYKNEIKQIVTRSSSTRFSISPTNYRQFFIIVDSTVTLFAVRMHMHRARESSLESQQRPHPLI